MAFFFWFNFDGSKTVMLPRGVNISEANAMSWLQALPAPYSSGAPFA